jgi:pimeloyl-ACP methyl ester carboxylesterase
MIAGVVVPGHGYGPQAPLLDLAAEAMRDLGATVQTITWSPPDGLLEIGPEPYVRAHVLAALHQLAEAAPDARPVLIGKSLGTYAVHLAAERQLPTIWLTPLLHLDGFAEAIARSPAPALLVGGTRDQSWVPEAAARTGKTVVTIEGGDHGLRPPGPLRAYTDALGVVGTAMEGFLSRLLGEDAGPRVD